MRQYHCSPTDPVRNVEFMKLNYFEAEDGVRLAYRETGQGLPVLALAGLTRDSRDFDYLLQHHPQCRLICLDSRGRGASAWAAPQTYTLAQEAKDALRLLDHLGLARAAILGTSRGGLLGMILASTAHKRLLGLCLNDVGPVLEREGLLRIANYVGVKPAVATLKEMALRLPQRSPGFANVAGSRWMEEAERHFTEGPEGVGLPYDPGLSVTLGTVPEGPLPDAWPLFDACTGLPQALIRGANSDILSAATATEMRRRRPDMLHVEIPGRGHVPFLDEPEAVALINDWLQLMKKNL